MTEMISNQQSFCKKEMYKKNKTRSFFSIYMYTVKINYTFKPQIGT